MADYTPVPPAFLPPIFLARRRVIIACAHCRKRKIRCITPEDPPQNPCGRCTKKGLKCEYITMADQKEGTSMNKTAEPARGALRIILELIGMAPPGTILRLPSPLVIAPRPFRRIAIYHTPTSLRGALPMSIIPYTTRQTSRHRIFHTFVPRGMSPQSSEHTPTNPFAVTLEGVFRGARMGKAYPAFLQLQGELSNIIANI
ncbi:hypothetical protein B0H14DRAFT_3445376 [Mycena olivaceomarginata]|nr:hypothetical protein B0H14DRAFT_3445376 [Mycena olivaceomarginata]